MNTFGNLNISRAERVALLEQLLEERILVIDGAMGTAIQERNLNAKDFGGESYEGCNEYLVITKPEIIAAIHEAHLKAGCDIILTNTFGGTPLVLDEYQLGKRAYEINFEAVQLAKRLTEKYSTLEKPRFIAGSMGPTTRAISVTGGITFKELIENFYTQAKALFEGGVDYLLLETCQDTRNIKAGLLAIDRLFKEKKESIPIAISSTIESTGTMLAGQAVDALVASLPHRKLLYLGINCATGPELMTDHVRTLADLSPFRVACVPNAGLPDEYGHYLETPNMMSSTLQHFIDKQWINLIGGCCGTTACHIESFANLVKGRLPRVPKQLNQSVLSGIDYLEVSPELRPVLVGERANVIGSRKFKDLISTGKFEEASEIARTQVKKGAHVVDICLANPDRNEKEDMENFFKVLIKTVKAPLMIDSTDSEVIEMALTYCQGKALINSINLEDGEERFEAVVPLAKTYGAALVVGCIDENPEQGMGVTRQRKLEIATRSYQLLTQKYGISPQDIYWDPLVFPCGTGDAQYAGSALETIEGIRLIKKHFPLTKTVLGISNVSFGLPNHGREVLNAVFLYHCVLAGLDLAIVNTEKLERYAQIPEEERKLSEDLLFNRDPEALSRFAAHFRSSKKTKAKSQEQALPLEKRLANYIIEGTKEGLIPDLEQALKTQDPLSIINGPLMAGMDQVGKLFNSNQLIVAEVLQSAEVMKAAVTFLEPFMEKTESSVRGKVLLATVKGDVHDIGKNLVDIIFSNNGFKVINLGIKIPPEQLIQAVTQHAPDIIGLSGLLVKSAHQMVLTADDFSKANISTPIIVGGAALSSNFVDKQIAKAYTTGFVTYAKDAMSGLDLAKKIVNAEAFLTLKKETLKKREALEPTHGKTDKTETSVKSEQRSPKIDILTVIPTAPDYRRHLATNNPPIDVVWQYINPMMLLNRHLGIKGPTVKKLMEMKNNSSLRSELLKTDPKGLAIWDSVEELKKTYRNSPIMEPRAVWRFFRCYSENNKIHLGLNSENGAPFSREILFEFPREATGDRLCISDFCDPDPEREDNLALFVVTVGRGVREAAEELKNSGEYLKSHILQALALESAEGYAELLHSQIRRMWGNADSPDMSMLERFQAKYSGKRYSFGYPACPELSDQRKLFKALAPEEIGVSLTEGDMMDPEASVSAIVFHHRQSRYFSVNTGSTKTDANVDF
jgi:5-methyltetrahydrofolate--homocysteine methyltransferase